MAFLKETFGSFQKPNCLKSKRSIGNVVWFCFQNKLLENPIKKLAWKNVQSNDHSTLHYGNTGCGVFKRGVGWGWYQRKLLNFENWVNGEVSKSTKIWLSKSIFYVKTHRNLSQFFFIHLRAHFLLLTFFYNVNLLITLLSKMMPIFWHLSIYPTLKIQ